MKLYEPFHELFSVMGETTNQLLELCQDEEMRKLLLRQQEAIGKAMEDYHKVMKEKEAR